MDNQEEAPDEFLNFLSRPQRVAFIPFGGSGGDRLIQFATQRLIQESAIAVTNDIEEADYIAYPGRGLFGFYPNIELLKELSVDSQQPLVFFPGACLWESEAVLAEHVTEFNRLQRPLMIFSRDLVSLQQWTLLKDAVDVETAIYSSHDCVVLYDAIFQRNDRDAMRQMYGLPHPELVGIYLRRDKESAQWSGIKIEHLPTLSLDPGEVGQVLPPVTNRPMLMSCSAFWYVSYMPDLVITDRLHVMLARWLFGQKTILLPTINHKVEAVWEHSISHNPRGVEFVKSTEQLNDILERELGKRG